MKLNFHETSSELIENAAGTIVLVSWLLFIVVRTLRLLSDIRSEVHKQYFIRSSNILQLNYSAWFTIAVKLVDHQETMFVFIVIWSGWWLNFIRLGTNSCILHSCFPFAIEDDEASLSKNECCSAIVIYSILLLMAQYLQAFLNHFPHSQNAPYVPGTSSNKTDWKLVIITLNKRYLRWKRQWRRGTKDKYFYDAPVLYQPL